MYVDHPLVRKEAVKLRRYQEAVVSRALDKNTLVVLPTGLGKTMIAAMVAAHRLLTYEDSKILFLAPTRPLALQHEKAFKKILAVEEAAALTGKDAVEKRQKIWNASRMLFATPQTIENDIMRGLDMSDVSLLVVDECHRSVGNYSYVHIAEEYMRKAKNPLILGLTASPSSDKATVDEICKNLAIAQVEAKTEKDPDVAPYVQNVKTEWVKVDLPREFESIKKIIESLLRSDLQSLKAGGFLDSSNLSKVNRRTLLQLQSEIRKAITAGDSDAYMAASLAASALKIYHALELLESQGIGALDSYLSRLSKQQSKAVKRLLSDPRMQGLIKAVHDLRVLGVEHPKLDALAGIVKEHEKDKVIVFTQYRDTVERIIERLNSEDILAREFVGQAAKDGKKGMSQKEQVKVLENFAAGKYTALVATSVAEEGIDIPKVDVVVFYEPVPSEIRSIQRRGRTGRSEAGQVFVLMAKGTRDEAYYWAAFHKEKKMAGMVKKMREGYGGDSGQQSLVNYSKPVPGENKTLKIYVDNRERNTSLLKVLRGKAEVSFKQLPVGDFILSDSVGVERKTKEDFVSSLIDKRLMAQAKELARNFEKPLLVVEGREDIYSLRDIHANAIRGALASLALDFGISVLFTQDEADTAYLLLLIAKREQQPENREVSLRGEKKPLSLTERQRYVVESLPNVSAVLARRLLERFGSVDAVFSAQRKELMEVEGIGEKKADKIRETVKSKYGNN